MAGVPGPASALRYQAEGSHFLVSVFSLFFTTVFRPTLFVSRGEGGRKPFCQMQTLENRITILQDEIQRVPRLNTSIALTPVHTHVHACVWSEMHLHCASLWRVFQILPV